MRSVRSRWRNRDGRLRGQLHASLLESEQYRENATVLEGCSFPHEVPLTQLTVLDLMTQEVR